MSTTILKILAPILICISITCTAQEKDLRKTGFFRNDAKGVYEYYYLDTLIYSNLTKMGESYCMDGRCASGKIVLKDGGLYKGDVKNGVANGVGTIDWPNGLHYEGEVRNNMMHGKGRRSSKTDYFEGEYVNNEKVYGTKQFANGSIYTGPWKNNMPDGYGKLTGNGAVVEGLFIQNNWMGPGSLTLANGDRYESDQWYDYSFIRGRYFKNGSTKGIVGKYYYPDFEELSKVEDEAEDKFDKDTRQWIKECTRAIKKGNMDSLVSLGLFYSAKDGLRHKGYDLLRQGVAKDHVGSLYAMGNFYEYVAYRLYDSALIYYDKAASLGSVQAIYRMGKIYDHGNLKDSNGNFISYSHVQTDRNKAMELFKKGAQRYYEPCINEYEYLVDEDNGEYYNKGALLNNAKKYKEAMPYLEKAAGYGISQACFLLGQIYDRGSGGVPVDEAEANKWFIKEGDLGNSEGYYRAGLYYSVNKNYDRAFELYEKAIAMGNWEAKQSLEWKKDQIKRDKFNAWCISELERKKAAGIDVYAPYSSGNNTNTTTTSSQYTPPPKDPYSDMHDAQRRAEEAADKKYNYYGH